MTTMDVFFLEISDLMRWKKGCDNKQITDEKRRKGKYFVAWAINVREETEKQKQFL